jgi:hypothetical protein
MKVVPCAGRTQPCCHEKGTMEFFNSKVSVPEVSICTFCCLIKIPAAFFRLEAGGWQRRVAKLEAYIVLQDIWEVC